MWQQRKSDHRIYWGYNEACNNLVLRCTVGGRKIRPWACLVVCMIAQFQTKVFLTAHSSLCFQTHKQTRDHTGFVPKYDPISRQGYFYCWGKQTVHNSSVLSQYSIQSFFLCYHVLVPSRQFSVCIHTITSQPTSLSPCIKSFLILSNAAFI